MLYTVIKNECNVKYKQKDTNGRDKLNHSPRSVKIPVIYSAPIMVFIQQILKGKI